MFTGMRFTAMVVAMTAGLAACTSSEPAGAAGQQADSGAKVCIRPADIVRQDIVSDDYGQIARRLIVWSHPALCYEDTTMMMGGCFGDVVKAMAMGKSLATHLRINSEDRKAPRQPPNGPAE